MKTLAYTSRSLSMGLEKPVDMPASNYGLTRVGVSLQEQPVDRFCICAFQDGEALDGKPIYSYQKRSSISLLLEAERTQQLYGNSVLQGLATAAPYTELDSLASNLTDDQLLDACVSRYLSHHGDIERFTQAEMNQYRQKMQEAAQFIVDSRNSKTKSEKTESKVETSKSE